MKTRITLFLAFLVTAALLVWLLPPAKSADCHNGCGGRPCGPALCPGGCVCAGAGQGRLGRCVG